jgi:long-chain acyl-CoA synthetase
MLYQLWKHTLAQHASAIAIHEWGKEREWTFQQMDDLLQQRGGITSPAVARSGDIEFFLQILHAWKCQQPVVLVERELKQFTIPSAIPTDCALIKFVPDRENQVRAIFFTAEQIIADATRIVEAMKMAPNSPNLAAISMAHSYGFSSVVLPMILFGVPIIALSTPFPALAASALRAFDNLTIFAVPAIWRAWLQARIFEGALVQQVRLAVSAGAPLALDLEQHYFLEHGIKIHNFYGASECGAIAWDASDLPRNSEKLLGTIFAGVDCTAQDHGNLMIVSDAVATAYSDDHEDEILQHPQFLINDQIEIRDGSLWIIRSNPHFFNIAGRKIAIGKISTAFHGIAGLQRYRILGIPSEDPERVTEIVALLEMDETLGLRELKCHVAKTLDSWAMPRRWLVSPPESCWLGGSEEIIRLLEHLHHR